MTTLVCPWLASFECVLRFERTVFTVRWCIVLDGGLNAVGWFVTGLWCWVMGSAQIFLVVPRFIKLFEIFCSEFLFQIFCPDFLQHVEIFCPDFLVQIFCSDFLDGDKGSGC